MDDNFNKIYEKYRDYLYKYVYGKIKNKSEIEDVIQETFVKVYKNLKYFDKRKSKFSNFLLANANQVLAEYYRSSSSDEDKTEEMTEEISIEDYKYFEKINGEYGLAKFLDKLPEAQRKAVELVYGNGFSYKNAGLIMNKSESSIKSLVFRAKANLKEMIEKENPEIVDQYLGRKIFKIIILCLVSVGMITGITCAIIKLYKEITKNNTYTLEEMRKEIPESTVNLSREEAIKIIENDLFIIKGEHIDVEKGTKLIKDYELGKVCWSYIDGKDIKIYVDAFSGKLLRYTSSALSNNDLKDRTYKELLIELGVSVNEYELYSEENIGGFTKIVLCKKYGELYNEYQSITVMTSGEMLANIVIYDLEYTDNDVLIDKDEAIKICEEKYGKCESIELVIDNIINKDYIWNNEDEIFLDNDDSAKEELESLNFDIRKVWKVINGNNKIFIDATTGEIFNMNTADRDAYQEWGS